MAEEMNNMDEEKRIEQQVMKTLHGLSTLEDIDAPPFLLTRLRSQIREYEDDKARSTCLRFHRRDLRLALLLVLLVFNILTVVFTMHYRADLHKHSLAAFTEEYGVTQNIVDLTF
jgi:hypothetical protein